MRIPLNA